MSSLPKGRPTHCLIDLAALRWNFQQVKNAVARGVKVLSIVKANAYGHGACEAAKTLAKAGSDGFGVATLEEGIELREAGSARRSSFLLPSTPSNSENFCGTV
jgi:alanine racemase